LILGLLSQPTAELSQLTTTSDQPRPAVVRVNTDDGAMASHGTGTCVAWTVDYGLILTAWHVIKDNQGQVTVDFWYEGQDEPERIDATVVATSRTLDLAALVVKRPLYEPSLIPKSSRYPFIRLARITPTLGDKVTIAGYDGGGTPTTYKEATGIVKGFLRPSNGSIGDWMMITAGARSGDSGGPMLSVRGTLVGVLWGTDNIGAHGTHCERLRTWLREAVKPEYPKLVKRALFPFDLFDGRNNQNNPENPSDFP